MKYGTDVYVRAYIHARKSVTHKEYSELDESFCELLRSHGEMPHAETIMKEIESALVNEQGGRHIVIESARELSKTLLKKILSSCNEHDIHEEKVNFDLVAGVRITYNGEREIDSSLRKQLTTLLT